MRSNILLACTVLLATSCGTDREVGVRFRAERDLWRADWEFRNLSIRPKDVSEAQWSDLARKFESIAQRYTGAPASDAQSPARRETQTIAARALFTAAQVHSMLGDSARVNQVFEQMARDFDNLPDVRAEVALARGRIAESRREPDRAAELYQTVVDQVAPDPDGTGAPGMVMDLPLRIARLRSQAAPGSSPAAHYADARAYYERLAQEQADDRTKVEALTRLADIAVDLQEWERATEALRALEAQLAGMENPPRDPSEARLAIANVQLRSGADPQAIRATLLSVVEDYPQSKLVPQVLLALAGNADAREQVDEALGYLDRIADEHKTDEEAVSQALLTRSKLLESHDRWSEALQVLRDLPARYPLSDAALWAPLEIARHHSRVGDKEATTAALDQAERHYRDFIARYPPGPPSMKARERLAQTLALEEKYDEAITELVSAGDQQIGTRGGATLLIAAAAMAGAELADTARAAGILEHAGEIYSKTDIGKWAAGEAARLREAMAR